MVRKMNIYDIKRKANELLVNHDKLFKVLLYIGIIQAIFSAVSTLFDGVVGGIVSLIIIYFDAYIKPWGNCSVLKNSQ